MDKNLSTLISSVRGWVDHTGQRLEDDPAKEIINSIISELARHDSMFNEFTENITVKAGSDSVDLQTGLTNKFSRPFSLWYTDSSSNIHRVEYMPPDAFEKKYQNVTATGDLASYTIWGHKMILGPIPDEELTLTIKFYGYPADLTGDTSTNKYLEYAWDVIRYGTLGEVCLYLIEDKRYPIFNSKYEKLRRQFLIEHARSKSSGKEAQSTEPGYLEE